MVHGSVLAALLAGVLACWTTLALLVALLSAPVATMTTLAREGAWGVVAVIRHGSSVIVSGDRPALPERSTR